MKKATKKTAAGKRKDAGRTLKTSTRIAKKAKPAPKNVKRPTRKTKKSKVEQPSVPAIDHVWETSWVRSPTSGSLADSVEKADVSDANGAVADSDHDVEGDPYTDGDDADPATEDN